MTKKRKNIHMDVKLDFKELRRADKMTIKDLKKRLGTNKEAKFKDTKRGKK